MVYARPEVSLENQVVIVVHIEMPANGIGMQVHKDNVG